MFLRQEDFATVVRSTPLVSPTLLSRTVAASFCLAKEPTAGAGLLVCAGRARAERRNAGSAFERLTMAELGLRLPITAGRFTVSGSTFMTITSPARISPSLCGARFSLQSSGRRTVTAGEQHDDYHWLTPDALLASDNVTLTAAPIFSLRSVPEYPDYKILVYGINYSPELTGIGKYTARWWNGWRHKVMRCGLLPHPLLPAVAGGRELFRLALQTREGAATVWRCPLYVPKQPSTLNACCISAVLPSAVSFH